MKLYKISGSSEYVEWDILHNQQGYSTSATNPVTWKSSLGNNWGETVANGYMEPTAASGWATKGFCLGKRGWHNMDDMANIYYVWPDVATSAKARHDTWGESDVAVWDYDGTHTLYLVQKELEEGWMDEDTFAERGWEIVPDVPLGELVFVDASGSVVYSVESLNEMVFAPTGYFTIEDDSEVLFVEQSPYPARGSLAKNYTPNVTIADGSGVDTELPYYSQKLYIPVVVWHDENWNLGADYFGWDLSDSSGSVYATNNTGSSRIVISIIIAMIDATDAEIVEVKNPSDAHFHAFKWTSGGVPYWYVVDGDEDWTDDLEADGYEEVPSVVLPTVSGQTWCTFYHRVQDSYENVPANTVARVYKYSGGFVLIGYDANLVYAIKKLYYRYGNTSGVEMPMMNDSGYLAAQNTTASEIQVEGCYFVTCSDSTATVIAVYDSSNVAYNAFKFSASGTDYYYVLDGVQADWTDDLSSIGYSLTQSLDVFFFYALNQSTSSPNAVQFSANDYWFAYVIDSDDRTALQSFGVALTQQDSKYLVKGSNSQFAFEILGLYSGVRTGDLSADLSNFYCETSSSGALQIRNHTAYTTNTATWKCRITRIS